MATSNPGMQGNGGWAMVPRLRAPRAATSNPHIQGNGSYPDMQEENYTLHVIIIPGGPNSDIYSTCRASG